MEKHQSQTNERLILGVSDFIALTNQTLEYAYPNVEIVGEVSGFKVNQGKYVFFDIKDDDASVGCFMMLFSLRTQLEDGMKIVVTAQPKLTQWGKFSLTVRTVQLVGEGSLKRSFELLKAKLSKEGLFEPARKRSLPSLPSRIGVISSTGAAGYADFIKILGQRWSGLVIEVAHTQVQGLSSPEQIIHALQYFNERPNPPEVLSIIRGGGSLDDLNGFNDELLVRAIASSRIPIITGIGHETDLSLADMAADVVASTPSNAAQILVPDKKEFLSMLDAKLFGIITDLEHYNKVRQQQVDTSLEFVGHHLERQFEVTTGQYSSLLRSLSQLNPRNVLKRGYSLVKLENGKTLASASKGDMLDIETSKSIIKAEVQSAKTK